MTHPMNQPVNPFNPFKELAVFRKDVENKLRDQIVAIFANPLGMQLLDTLDDLYIRQPVCPPGSPEGFGYMREGENRLILKIRAIVNSAQQGDK